MDEKDFVSKCLSGVGGGGAYQSIPTNDREFLVTATLQIAVRANNAVEAQIDVKDLLNDIIAGSDFYNDPLNGATIVRVEDL
jgi:hypothetical protein